MAKTAVIFALAALLGGNAHALNKCTDSNTGQVNYSDKPCPGAQIETKMDRPVKPAPRAASNRNAATVVPPPELTGSASQRLSTITAAFENMAADALECKIALQVNNRASMDVVNRCTPHSQQMTHWWPVLFSGLKEISTGDEGQQLLPKLRQATRQAQRVTEYAEFNAIRLTSLANR